jgi:hypothetical protein
MPDNKEMDDIIKQISSTAPVNDLVNEQGIKHTS